MRGGGEGGTKWRGQEQDETKPHLKDAGRPASVHAVCVRLKWRQVPMGHTKNTLRLAKMAGCSARCGHLMACLKAAYLVSIIHLVLANNFGVSLPRSLQAALYPGRGTLEKPRSTAPQGGTRRAPKERHAYMEKRPELNATCHAPT